MQRVLNQFQPDAVEIETRSVPGGARWTLYTVGLLLVAAIAWSWWAKVDLIVMAPGKVVSLAPATVIQGASGAPIKSMVARFGQIVRPGDTLATLDPTFSEADVRQLTKKIDGFKAEIARLDAERDSVPFSVAGHEQDPDWSRQLQAWRDRQKEFLAKQEEFASEKAKVESQAASNEIELKNQEKRRKAIQELYDTTFDLHAKGHKPYFDLLNAQVTLDEQKAKIDAAINKRDEFTAELEVIAKRRAAYEAGWRAEVAGKLLTAYTEMNSLTEDLNKALRSQEYTTIPVPASDEWKEFYVLEVAERSLGSVIQQGEALFRLAPLGAPLEIEMEIPSRDVGRTRVGDEVNIKLTAYPYQKHGYLQGKITTISEGTAEREAQPGMPPVTFYRARVSINPSPVLEQVPEDFRLIPDMVAECEIKVGRRRVMEFFLYPIWRAFDSSIREP